MITYRFDVDGALLGLYLDTDHSTVSLNMNGQIKIWDACQWRLATQAEADGYAQALYAAQQNAPRLVRQEVLLPLVFG